jgi:ankyrin repeat protein
MAARYGNVPAVRALLRAGAEASHADASGWHMPLHHITHCKSCSEAVGLRIAQLLLDAGAEPGRARDKKGVTATESASRRGWTSFVKLLRARQQT